MTEEKIFEMRVYCAKYILLMARTYHTIHQTITFEVYWGKKERGLVGRKRHKGLPAFLRQDRKERGS